MEIELDELKECDNCGIVFNKIQCSEYMDLNSNNRKGECPLCKEEFYIWE